jgi:formate dehydrogenase subunit delta
MMSTDQRLAYMADQIARNFAAMGHDHAVAATADHIAKFWDPGMKQRAFALLDRAERGTFTKAAESALRILQAGAIPASQTPATQFNEARGSGHSDAG